jgi:hypothetical protein
MEILAQFITTFVSTPLKFSFWLILLPSLFVLVSAVLSAKSLGGELGTGLKKVAAGTITYVILYLTIISKEYFQFETMSPESLRLFFVFINIFGSTLLIWGFYQIYRVSKKLKLF